jgi:integrase/recombinase XerD
MLLDNHELNRDSIFKYQLHLAKSEHQPSTIAGKLSVLHCYLDWLYKQGLTLADLSQAVCFPRKQKSLPKGILSELEVKCFLSLPDVRTRKGIRDKAILELLYSAAIRRAELTGLNLYDLNIDEQTIRVLGKGRKERTVPVGDTALYWLLKYIREIRQTNGSKEKALFLDLYFHKRLDAQTITNLVYEYAKQSRLNKKITPHSFRHSCAAHLLKNGVDIRYIQELLGHASLSTTQIYTHVVKKDLKEVFRRTHPRATRKIV